MKKFDKIKLQKIFFLCFLVAIILLTILLWPFFNSFNSHDKLIILKETINNYGFWGIFMVIGLQILQIIVALIPGEVIEFVSGAMYGTFGGLIVCLVGVIIGQWIIYKVVEILGHSFVEAVTGKEKIKKLKFLQNEKRLETITFILFFIPGTPKDLLTYFMPLTKINLKRFLLISTIARIPSIVSSTYAGATFITGDIKKMLIIYLVIGTVSIIGLMAYNIFFNKKVK